MQTFDQHGSLRFSQLKCQVIAHRNFIHSLSGHHQQNTKRIQLPDLPTLRALAQRDPNTKFFVPLENGPLLRGAGIENTLELDWGQAVEHDGLRVFCLPSQHWSKRRLNDDLAALWSSWAVVGSERRFYFAGDTGYFSGFKQIGNTLGPFDLAAVPVGAYEPVEMMRDSHMNPEEAVMAANDVKANSAVAMHFGTFNLSDEPLADPPARFITAGRNSSLGSKGTWVLKIGETRNF